MTLTESGTDLGGRERTSIGAEVLDVAGATRLSTLVDRQRRALEQELAVAQSWLLAKRMELRDFKIAVRERVWQAKLDEGWCDDGFNAAMYDLGLPPYEPIQMWTGTVSVEVPVTVIGTRCEYTARDWAREAISRLSATSSDPDVEFDTDDAHVDSVYLDLSEDSTADGEDCAWEIPLQDC